MTLSYKRALLTIATGVGLAACTDTTLNPADNPDRDDGVETTTDTAPPGLEEDPIFDALFDISQMPEIHIDIPLESQQALLGDPRTYVPATVELGGKRFENIGLHFKGSSSFQELSGKPSLKLRFDKYEAGRTYGKIHRLTLNNMVQDPSQAREILTYWLFNEGGGLAPRANYAKVTINGTFYGLYTLLEPMDHAFLQRRFLEPDGDLWEGVDGADFTAGGVGAFELKTGDGNRTRLADIATAFGEPTADFYSLADQFFVMDQALDFWGLQMATACFDGYPYHLNDWFLYSDPAAGGRFVVSPWGMDEAWDPTFEFQWGQGSLFFNCAADRACLAKVYEHVETALVRVEEAGAAEQLQRFFDQSADVVAADPRRGWTPAEVAQARTDLLELVEAWPAQLRAQIAAAQ